MKHFNGSQHTYRYVFLDRQTEQRTKWIIIVKLSKAKIPAGVVPKGLAFLAGRK